ncbi:conserved Plasmodium protein, unknown function [Plasmodium ovale curtisi]|uniref:Uncharacterized protein n=1 Tax=Plasmodium ovale curtisi TaxID=864141 RepID=A0A1A8VP45_PLAOA|nr:conserved Plasmodium protein, unknown function [Plasmodium ovale curtisi]
MKLILCLFFLLSGASNFGSPFFGYYARDDLSRSNEMNHSLHTLNQKKTHIIGTNNEVNYKQEEQKRSLRKKREEESSENVLSTGDKDEEDENKVYEEQENNKNSELSESNSGSYRMTQEGAVSLHTAEAGGFIPEYDNVVAPNAPPPSGDYIPNNNGSDALPEHTGDYILNNNDSDALPEHTGDYILNNNDSDKLPEHTGDYILNNNDSDKLPEHTGDYILNNNDSDELPEHTGDYILNNNDSNALPEHADDYIHNNNDSDALPEHTDDYIHNNNESDALPEHTGGYIPEQENYVMPDVPVSPPYNYYGDVPAATGYYIPNNTGNIAWPENGGAPPAYGYSGIDTHDHYHSTNINESSNGCKCCACNNNGTVHKNEHTHNYVEDINNGRHNISFHLNVSIEKDTPQQILLDLRSILNNIKDVIQNSQQIKN